MPHKLNCALLVDEDRATNIFNKMVISRHDSFHQVVSVPNTDAALKYLETIEIIETDKPDAIFLDYAISCTKGSDFFAKFKALNKSITHGIKIFIMASHVDAKTIDTTVTNFPIDELISVPLSFPLLNCVLERHFNNSEKHETGIENFTHS